MTSRQASCPTSGTTRPAFRFDQAVDPLLDRAAADELVDEDVFGLSDAEGAVGRLVLDRRVPPAIEVDDVRGGGEIETGAPLLERQHEVADRVDDLTT